MVKQLLYEKDSCIQRQVLNHDILLREMSHIANEKLSDQEIQFLIKSFSFSLLLQADLEIRLELLQSENDSWQHKEVMVGWLCCIIELYHTLILILFGLKHRYTILGGWGQCKISEHCSKAWEN